MVQDTRCIKSGEEAEDSFIDVEQLKALYERLEKETPIFKRVFGEISYEKTTPSY